MDRRHDATHMGRCRISGSPSRPANRSGKGRDPSSLPSAFEKVPSMSMFMFTKEGMPRFAVAAAAAGGVEDEAGEAAAE